MSGADAAVNQLAQGGGEQAASEKLKASEDIIGSAALSLQRSRRLDKLASLTRDKAEEDAGKKTLHQKAQAASIQHKMETEFAHLEELRHTVLEARQSTVTDVEAKLHAQDLGMRMAKKEAEHTTEHAREVYNTARDAMLRTQASAADADAAVTEATANDDNAASVKVLQAKADGQTVKSEEARKEERAAHELLHQHEEASKQQADLMREVKARADEMYALIRNIEAAKKGATQAAAEVEATRMRRALEQQDKADEEQATAIETAMRYVDAGTADAGTGDVDAASLEW